MSNKPSSEWNKCQASIVNVCLPGKRTQKSTSLCLQKTRCYRACAGRMALLEVIVKKSVGSSTLATYILDIYVPLGSLILSLWMQRTTIPSSSDLNSPESQQPTAGQVRSSDAAAPRDLDFLHVMFFISQVRFDLLDARALAQIHADLALFIRRIEHHNNVRAVFVNVSRAEEVAVADADAVGIGADVTGEVCKGPCAFGDFVLAVLDFDQLLVFVVVCVAVLDDEPPVPYGQYTYWKSGARVLGAYQ